MEKHGYVKLIEYALSNKGFSKEEACKEANISQSDFDFASKEIFILNKSQLEYIHPNEVQEWKLNPQAYFNYLQYCEYKHSIKTARTAHKISLIAIAISGVLALGSIVASIAA